MSERDASKKAELLYKDVEAVGEKGSSTLDRAIEVQ
jgi:hypothetical protein